MEFQIQFDQETLCLGQEVHHNQIETAARVSYMRWQNRGPGGQMIMPADSYEYHLIGAAMACERKINKEKVTNALTSIRHAVAGHKGNGEILTEIDALLESL